ncbi:MAG: winged helix DNA-binding domain-containing protein [Chloroflexota bacterium]|nr:MAG: winged helix DNA-binding domain-containing protein [Chloroflexota bacterium]
MKILSRDRVEKYQQRTFNLEPGRRITSKEQAIRFVNQRGFIFFWPIKGIQLPSLWSAVAGDRPVADAHDDPGHVTWGWKDSLLGGHRWYYAKVLRKKSTIISLVIAPYFYALTENYGSPEEDYLLEYMQGRMTQEAKTVYEVLLSEGPLDTISLRRKAKLSSRESDSRFNRALTDLQAEFKILPVGTSQAGGWRYSFIYETVHRHLPDLLEKARQIQEGEARQKLVHLYLDSVGAAPHRDLGKLFQWPIPQIDEAIDKLVYSEILIRGVLLGEDSEEWVALPALL